MYVCSTSILYYSLVLAMFSVVIIYTSIYGILAFLISTIIAVGVLWEPRALTLNSHRAHDTIFQL